MSTVKKRFVIRLWILGVVVSIVFFLLVFRLYFLQIVNHDLYLRVAEGQYVRISDGIYDRGVIFMENKNGALIAGATMRSEFTLVIDPVYIDDIDKTYEKLSAILTLDKEDFAKKASKEDDHYEIIASDLSKEDADAIRKLNLSGVSLVRIRKRYYPGDSFASHVIGFVGFDENNNRVGRYGLERYYESILKRSDSTLYVNFFAELFANISDIVSDGGREGDIVLTIDPDIQVFLEKELEKTRNKWQSKMTAGIIMNPQDGEIMGMAVSPSYDLNNFGSVKGVSFANPLVSGVYEMGSIIKVLTMAIGLDIGAINEKTTYNDTGSVIVDGEVIHNYDNKARGVVPMQEVLSRSLNVGIAFIVNKIGKSNMKEYLIDKLRLGEETGIDLPSEVAGMVENLESDREIEFVTAGFGQGVAFTPIAVIRALSAVANGGYLIQPHIVRRIEYTTGLSKEFDYDDQKTRVFKKETTDILAKMLTKVVDEVLAQGSYKMERYSISAKTGTAQIADKGGYKKDAYLHTFAGYGPSYNPEFIILLMNLEPKGANYASQTLTEPFMNMAKFLINHLEIPPDR